MNKRAIGNSGQRLTFAIPGPLPSLNKLLRMHWARRAALKKKYIWIFSAQADAPENTDKTKRRITIMVYQPARRFDEDNLVGATKLLVDALREIGVIYRDSPHWLERKVSQEIDRANPRVVITVEKSWKKTMP